MGLYLAGKVSRVGGLEAISSSVHSRRPKGLQNPDSSAYPEFSENVLLPADVNDHHQYIGELVALAGEMGRHRRFIHETMCDVEKVAVHAQVKGCPVSPTYWRPHLLHYTR